MLRTGTSCSSFLLGTWYFCTNFRSRKIPSAPESIIALAFKAFPFSPSNVIVIRKCPLWGLLFILQAEIFILLHTLSREQGKCGSSPVGPSSGSTENLLWLLIQPTGFPVLFV